MRKIINRSILKKLVYGVIIGVAVIGALFITAKTYPKMANVKNYRTEYETKTNIANLKTTRSRIATSRGNDETRKSMVNILEEKIAREEVINKNTENENNKTEESKIEENKDTTNYISINEVKISKNMDLTKRTGLSREDFIKLIAKAKCDTSGFFETNAGTIYDLCEKHSINEIFFCGLISAESGWNIASNHRRTHNYISLMKNGKLIKYSSVYEGLEVAAKKLHNNYLTPGGKFYHGKTLKGVKTNFCPASSTWVDLVYGRMKQIL